LLPGVGELLEVRFADPASGLEVHVSAKLFTNFPAVEWLTRFKNTGTKDSPLIENIQAMDAAFALPTSGPATLHWAKGGVASFDDFAPQTTPLKPGANFALEPGDGRSSSEVLPFFNLEGAGSGVVLAIGWSGRWAARFDAGAHGTVRARAGMAQTHLVLRPGEEIRTPSVLALFYQGDRWRGQNLLRQFILAHHRPRKQGQPLVAPITCGNWGGTRAEVHLDNIRKIIQERLPIEYYWIDAEWYGKGGWPVNVGDWTVKKELYPESFKTLSDALRRSGRELMLWFEPERVFAGTPWHRDHRAWLLDTGGSSLLFNLGHPDARRFLTDFISERITEFGLGCYRQDFNINPRPFWQKADAADRQGLTEIRHVEGLYGFWDELLGRHANLLIDNCASGGRRIDLETIGRATPFWRTDGPRDPIAHQCHTYGLLAWVPFSATSQDRAGDDYEFRSSMCSSLCLNWWVSGDVPAENIPADFPFEWARRTLKQYLDIRKFYYGDYYPLTAYSQARDVWMAYQLDHPDLGEGLVVALRRPQSPYESARFALRGLEENATYRVANLDTGERAQYSGRALLGGGLRIAIDQTPGSSLLTYHREQ
jgi:alpha-galactosidase